MIKSSRATAPPPPPHPRTHQKSFERSTTTTTTRLSPPAATFSLSLLDRTTFLSLSARPIFKAISPDLKNAATDHQDKSFVYLLLPFVSQSLFSRQRRGRRRALPHRVVWNRFLAVISIICLREFKLRTTCGKGAFSRSKAYCVHPSFSPRESLVLQIQVDESYIPSLQDDESTSA
ncbi:hypothetical protein P8452_40998 [Trifolium repens]|nr:hypothetical protein P8452_40998 [Trifolium repens]